MEVQIFSAIRNGFLGMATPRNAAAKKKSPKRLKKTATKKSASTRRAGTGGGRATAGGMNYEYRYAALLAATALLNDTAPTAWEVDSIHVKSIFMERDLPVDDIVCSLSDDGFAFIQAKSSLAISTAPTSKYAVFVRNVIELKAKCRTHLKEDGFPERDFDVIRDRIVLAIGSDGPIAQELASICQQARSTGPFRATRTLKTKSVYDRTVVLIQKYWKEINGAEPDTTDIRSFFADLYVHACNCKPSGADEDRALDALKSIILPSNRKAAIWQGLISHFGSAAARGAGFDITAICKIIRSLGADFLSADADHRADRSKLLAKSAEYASEYQHNTYLTIRGDDVTLRKGTQEELRKRAHQDSLFLVGDPGIGKTGAIVSLFGALKFETKNVVFIPIEQLRGTAALSVQLGLRNELPDIFRQWGVEGVAYLIVDGLDSARGLETLNDVLNELGKIRAVASDRWRIIASMRRYDAERAHRDVAFAKVFSSGSAPKPGAKFASLPLLMVPSLSDVDLIDAEERLPELKGALMNSALRELVRIPFNLKLLVTLIEDGASGSDLAGLQTQVEMLQQYWINRIERDDGQAAREFVLRAACVNMLKRNDLRFEDGSVLGLTPEEQKVLEGLCRIGLLVRMEAESHFEKPMFRFAHNVLFDFCFAKVMLGSRDRVLETLLAYPSCLTLITPSLAMYFSVMWHKNSDRSAFWGLLLRLASDERIPAVAELVGIAVATRQAEAAEDLQRFIDSLENPSTRETALKIVGFLHGSMQVGDVDPFVHGGEPWDRLVLSLARHPGQGADYHASRLQSVLVDGKERLSPTARKSVSEASRLLLKHWLRLREEGDANANRLLQFAIRNVVDTFAYDQSENGRLLEEFIADASFLENAWSDAPPLARHLSLIHAINPPLVTAIYKAIFSATNDSNESVDITGSKIFGFTSNRRQDLEHAKWQLGQDFKRFAKVSPLAATQAMLAAVSEFERIERADAKIENRYEIHFRDHSISYATDYSRIWLDSAVTLHKPAFEMLKEWFAEILELRLSDRRTYERCLDEYIKGSTTAALWRKLLLIAIESSETLGVDCQDLLRQSDILFGYDTTDVAGEYIRVAYPLLTKRARIAVEKVILKSPRPVESKLRLLGCIPEKSIALSETRRLLSESISAVPVNEVDPRISVITSAYTETDFLHERGAQDDNPAGDKLREARNAASALVLSGRNQPVPRAQVGKAIRLLKVLREALDAPGISVEHAWLGWDTLMEGCKALALTTGMSAKQLSFVRQTIADGLNSPEPGFDDNFDAHGSWGSPAPHVPAAIATMYLASLYPDAVSTDIITRAVNDPSKPARAQAAHLLTRLYIAKRDLMWSLCESIGSSERSSGVVLQFVNTTLGQLFGADRVRARALLQGVFERALRSGWNNVREACEALLLTCALQGDTEAMRVVRETIQKRNQRDEAFRQLLFALRNYMRSTQADVLDNVFMLFTECAKSLAEDYRTFKHSEGTTAEAAVIGKNIVAITEQIYFGSGVFKNPGNDDGPTIEDEAIFDRLHETIQILRDVDFSAAVFKIVETLAFFVDARPARVFDLGVHYIESAKRQGFQFEPMAADAAVGMMEKFLSGHREVIEATLERRIAFLRTLDTFAMWPKAVGLVYRFADSFR